MQELDTVEPPQETFLANGSSLRPWLNLGEYVSSDSSFSSLYSGSTSIDNLLNLGGVREPIGFSKALGALRARSGIPGYVLGSIGGFGSNSALNHMINRSGHEGEHGKPGEDYPPTTFERLFGLAEAHDEHNYSGRIPLVFYDLEGRMVLPIVKKGGDLSDTKKYLAGELSLRGFCNYFTRLMRDRAHHLEIELIYPLEGSAKKNPIRLVDISLRSNLRMGNAFRHIVPGLRVVPAYLVEKPKLEEVMGSDEQLRKHIGELYG